ncbi:MAG TPA: GrpB family protein [Chitinophagaceae bacterium]|jgi:GrpB-like predicted nucleotidyltransferase (UPF0157 family)|nr:GrpB family protein [Chitinophagaceae bacterium]
MSQARIIIEEYSPFWASAFEQLKSVYLAHLADLILDVQHVGSTAVPGLAAKPVIDIDLIISERAQLDPVVEKLRLLGYDHLGDRGISEREAFRPRSAAVPYNDHYPSWPKHHLYVCPAGSNSLMNHIAFRDFLRSHPDQAKAYGALKKRLVSEDPYDINLYVERKTPFITEILREAGFDEHSINRIALENRPGV